MVIPTSDVIEVKVVEACDQDEIKKKFEAKKIESDI